MVAILHPVGPGPQIPIDRAVVLIGRSPECDVVLDISSKISRMHCALVQVDADYFIRDLGSMNGVTVAGQKVEKDCKLANGVEVMIGDLSFRFLANVAPAARNNKQAPVAGRQMPVLIDETADVLDVEEIEDIEDVEMVPDNPRRSGMPSMSTRTPGKGTPRVPLAYEHPEVFEPEIMDADVSDAEIVDVDGIEIVEDIEDVEVIEDIDVVDAVEVIDDVDVIDVEIVEDVEIIDDDQPYRRPRRRR